MASVPIFNQVMSVREIERRILADFLDIWILLSLHFCDRPISGYDVIKYLQMRYGFLSSPGTVYSCLYDMERRGLLKGNQGGRKRVYVLTEYGKEIAKAILNEKEKIVKFVLMILS
ncbi:MAG: PadR family transcriptional regulator [Candidatus Bathyarchaeia archaeon]